MSIRSPVAVRGVPPRLSNWKLCHGSADTHVLLRHGTDSSNQAQLPPLRLQPWLRLLLLLVFRTTLKRRWLARDRTREAPALPVFVTKPQKNSDNPPRGVSNASPVKDSEIKAIMGSGDCAESKLRPVTMHRENIFLARLENTGGCSSCLPTPKRIH